jgi:hypothetical protein
MSNGLPKRVPITSVALSDTFCSVLDSDFSECMRIHSRNPAPKVQAVEDADVKLAAREDAHHMPCTI